LNETKLQELVKEFNAKMKESPPKFDIFLTENGKNFQKEIMNLFDFLDFNSILPSTPEIIPVFLKDLKNKIGENVDLDSEIEYNVKFQEFSLTEKKPLGEYMDSFSNPITINEDGSALITKSINRMNSYYFIALFAYMDHYVKSIHKDILTRYRAKQCIEYFDEFRRRATNLKSILESIRNKLVMGVAKEIHNLNDVNQWCDTFNKMKDLRHEFAHIRPEIRREVLGENFKVISDEIRKSAKTEFSKYTTSSNPDDELESKLFTVIKPYFETLLILREIGKHCLSYLAVHDHLVANFFQKNKPI